MAYGSSQARDQIQTTATTCISAAAMPGPHPTAPGQGSNPCCRDNTRLLTYSAKAGTPFFYFLGCVSFIHSMRKVYYQGFLSKKKVKFIKMIEQKLKFPVTIPGSSLLDEPIVCGFRLPTISSMHIPLLTRPSLFTRYFF